MTDDADGKAAQTARDDLEAARVEVMDTEKKIKLIKDTLRRVSLEQDKPNELTIAALKITDLPPTAQPSFHLQLSSPIEELPLPKLYDPSNPTDTSATFNGVETSMAMLTVKVKDGDCHLGSSESVEVTTWCVIEDALQPKKLEREVEVKIFPDEESGYTTATTSMMKDEGVTVETTAAEEAKEPTATTTTTKEEETTDGKEEECQETVIVEEKDAIEESTATTKEEGGATPEGETTAETMTTTTTTDGGEADDKAAESTKETAKEDATPDEPKVESSTKTESKTEDTTISSPPPTTETKDDSPTTTTTTPESKPTTISDSTTPICTITFKITFKPSPKDQKDALYDLLNKTSKTKAVAMEKLRQSAIAVSRTQRPSGTTSASSSPAVKAGFLNDSSKEKTTTKTGGMMGRLMGFYQRTLGPQSLVRVLFPIVKNYGLFLGVVVMMHYRGQELALPPPV